MFRLSCFHYKAKKQTKMDALLKWGMQCKPTPSSGEEWNHMLLLKRTHSNYPYEYYYKS